MVGNFGVAFGARNIFMNRIWQFKRISVERNPFIPYHFVKGLIIVTFHASIVRDPGLYHGDINFVGRMACGASWNDRWISFPEFSFDDLFMGLFDPRMALHAGAGNSVWSY